MFNRRGKGTRGVAMITRPDVKFTSKPREGFHQRALDEADFEKTEENLEAFHLFNREGRVMTCELEKAVIINTYVPNSGRRVETVEGKNRGLGAGDESARLVFEGRYDERRRRRESDRLGGGF